MRRSGNLDLGFLEIGEAKPKNVRIKRTSSDLLAARLFQEAQESEPTAFVLVPRHPCYRVGTDGSVWSIRSGEWVELTRHLNKDGYYDVAFKYEIRNIGGFRFCGKMLVHRLILLSFKGEPGPNQVSCHNNGIRTDNRPSNLRWGTVFENFQDAAKHKAERELARRYA